MNKSYKVFVMLGVLVATSAHALPPRAFPTPGVRGVAAKRGAQQMVVGERIRQFTRDFQSITLDNPHQAIADLNSLHMRIERTLYYNPKTKQFYRHNMEQQRTLLTMLGSVEARLAQAQKALEEGARGARERAELEAKEAREKAEKQDREAKAAKKRAERKTKETQKKTEREAKKAREREEQEAKAAKEHAEQEEKSQAKVVAELAAAQERINRGAKFTDAELDEVLEALGNANALGIDTSGIAAATRGRLLAIWQSEKPQLTSAVHLHKLAMHMQNQHGISFAPADRLIADYIALVQAYDGLKIVLGDYKTGNALLEDLRDANAVALQARRNLVRAGLVNRLSAEEFAEWGVPGIEQIEKEPERRGGIVKMVSTSTYGQLRAEVDTLLVMKGRGRAAAAPSRSQSPDPPPERPTIRPRPAQRGTQAEAEELSGSEAYKSIVEGPEWQRE